MGAKRGPAKKFEGTPQTAPRGPAEVSIVLHPVQKSFVDCEKIYKSFVAGVASGKSYVGAYDLLTHSKPGDLVAVCGPTYRQLADATMRSFIDLATTLGLWDESKYRKTDNQAMLNNGVEVLFRSGDNPASNRGPSLHRVWLDEAGLMQEEMFNVMVGRLRGGGEQGRLSATFTPQGKEHWTYRLLADKSNPNVELFHCSTRDNPFIAPEIYENLLLQYGKGEGGILRAKQELEGAFVCVQGAEWSPAWFGENLWFENWPEGDDVIRVTTLDSSKGVGGKTGDYSSFCNLAYAGGLIYVDFDMDSSRNTSTMAQTAIEIQRSFNPHFFGIESEFGGSVLLHDLETMSEQQNILLPLSLIPTQGIQKEIRLRRLTPYFSRGMVRFKNTNGTKIAVTQAEVFPYGEHDDGPDSLEMAIRLLNESGSV